MKEYLLLFILLSCSVALKAQTRDSAYFDPLTYRNHVGLNTQIIADRIFDPEARTPFELTYKKQLKDMRAWRVQLKSRYSREYEQYNTRAAYQIRETITNYQLGFSIGHEWQYFLGKRWLWYWGADAGYSIEQLIKDVENYEGITYTDEMTGKEHFLYSTRKLPNQKVSGAPFLGFRFHITPRLYISAEMKMLLQYAWQKDEYTTLLKFRDGSEREGGVIGFAKFRDFAIEFKPYSGFHIFFLL